MFLYGNQNSMLIRTHPCMNVLFSTRKATLGDLSAIAGLAIRELYQYVADLDLLVCGPQYWFYYGMDGLPEPEGGGLPIKSDKMFTLEICLPVQGKIPTALLPWFKRIPAFRCLSSRYEGPWEGLAEHYQKMIADISARQLKMSGVFAESFLHIDFDQPENQITDVQIGIS
jgi:effector-binding domain-containing protein